MSELITDDFDEGTDSELRVDLDYASLDPGDVTTLAIGGDMDALDFLLKEFDATLPPESQELKSTLGQHVRRWSMRATDPCDALHGAAILAHLQHGEAVTIPSTALECAMEALKEAGLHEAVTVTETDDKATLNMLISDLPTDDDDESRSVEPERRWKGGYPQGMVDWYNGGADGAIDWGSDGDFEDCVAIAGKYIDNPEGFCNLRHQDATGAPPGHAPGESEDKKDAPTGAELRDTAIIDYSGRVILPAPLQPGDTVVVAHTGGASDTYDEFEDMDAQLTTQQNASGHQHETRATINGQATRSADVAGKFSPVMVTAYRTGEAEHIAMALKKLYPEAYVAGLLASAAGDSNSPTAQAIQNTPILLALTEDLDGTMVDAPATVADATGTDWEAAKGLLNLLSNADQSGQNIAQYIGSDGAPNTEAQAEQMADTEAANGAEIGAQDAASAAGYSQMQSVPDDDSCDICQDKASDPYDIGDDGPPWHPRCGCESQPAGSADNTEQTSALGRHVRRWGKHVAAAPEVYTPEDRATSAETIARVETHVQREDYK